MGNKTPNNFRMLFNKLKFGCICRLNSANICLKNNLFSSVSSQRTALMGLAMIAVFLTHALSPKLGFIPTGFVGQIARYGYWGVDVFLFLSAFGLCHSLSKNDIKTFFRNRFVRILPLWLIVLACIHVIGVIVSSKMPELDFTYPKNLLDSFFWYSGLGFFLNTCCYEWYIPSLLFLYFISPLIFRCSRKCLYVLIPVIIMVYMLNHYCGFAQHLNILLQRLPVFFLGFLYFKENQEFRLLRFLEYEFLIVILALILVSCKLCSPTVLFGMLLPIVLMLLSNILSYRYIKFFSCCLAFVGSVSLEFYLIHLYRRPQYLFSFIVDDSNLQVFFAFVLCLVLSYILQIVVAYILRFFNI